MNPVQRKIRLLIDLGLAEFTDVLPKLRGDLFFDNFRQASEAIPVSARSLAPLHVDGSGGIEIFPPRDARESRITPPKFVKVVEPKYTEEAKQREIGGTARCGIVVSNTGAVDSVWLLRPIGSGLDENAMKAVAQYKLDPALLDGKPVSVAVKVDVNFQIQ